MVENVGRHHLAKKKKVDSVRSRVFDRNFDNLMFGVAVVGPFMALPQLIKIWNLKSAFGVSIISWSAFFLISVFWISYGILHKEKQIIISSTLWSLVQLLVVIGIVLYG
jgi:uncharacterized protein with PQ loop repeat